jgi:hypothetical protein
MINKVIESITNIWKRIDNTTSACPDISIGDLQSILIEEIAKNTNFQHFFQDIFTPEDEFVLSAVLLKDGTPNRFNNLYVGRFFKERISIPSTP